MLGFTDISVYAIWFIKKNIDDWTLDRFQVQPMVWFKRCRFNEGLLYKKYVRAHAKNTHIYKRCNFEW